MRPSLVKKFILYRIISNLLGAILNNEGAKGKIKLFKLEKIPFETLYLKTLQRYCKADACILKPYQNCITYQDFRPIEPNFEFWQLKKKLVITHYRGHID